MDSNEADPSLLKELNMDGGQLAAFVEEYVQRFDRIRKAGGGSGTGSRGVQNAFREVGSNEVREGSTAAGYGGIRGSERPSPDQLRRLSEQRARSVAPEYRKAVEDYFRAVSAASAPASQPGK